LPLPLPSLPPSSTSRRARATTTPYKPYTDKSHEARRRNQARRRELEASGGTLSKKWCTWFLQDKKLDDYSETSKDFFGRVSQCKVCISKK
jgi:hypothetical protein